MIIDPQGAQVPGQLADANQGDDEGEQVTVTGWLIASVAVPWNSTIVPDGPVAGAVRSPGRVSTGAVRSATVTVKVPVARLPLESLAVQTTSVVPIEKVDPERGRQSGVIAPSTRSVAVAV